MLGSIPPFEDLFKMAGMELPDYLKGKKEDNTKLMSDATEVPLEIDDTTKENIK